MVNRALVRPFVRNKSILARFVESIRAEARKDERFKDAVDEFGRGVRRLGDNSVVRGTGHALSSTRTALGRMHRSVCETGRSGIQNIVGGAKATSRYLFPPSKARRKVSREAVNPVAKRVSENIQNAQERLSGIADASVYGGILGKEARERRKRLIVEQHKQDEAERARNTVEENPDAGASVQVHKDSAWRAKWADFVENNPLARGLFGLKRTVAESDSLLAHLSRNVFGGIQDRLRSLFKESETAVVLREIAQRDPRFNVESFMGQLRSFVIPEVLEAQLSGDLDTLSIWASEAVFSVEKARQAAERPGRHHTESKVLDIRSVELVAAKMINDEPVLVVSFHAQQMARQVDPATDIIEDEKIVTLGHVWALTRETTTSNPLTGGWRLVEMATRPLW